MFRQSILFSTTAFVLLAAPTAGHAQAGQAGLRLGAGADLSGGVAFGGQLDYTVPKAENSVEIGLLGLGGTYTEETNNGFNDYTEETSLLVVGAFVNYLIGHAPELDRPYFLVGAGLGGIAVEWREESPTDTSLGSPLSGGGSFQEEDGTVGGFILNLGIGRRLNDQVDLRAQVPTLFIGGGTERETLIVPALVVTLGFGF